MVKRRSYGSICFRFPTFQSVSHTPTEGSTSFKNKVWELYFINKFCGSSTYKYMTVTLCWSANTGVSMCRSPSENVTYEFVLTSPAVPHMSCSSYFYGLWDGRFVTIQLYFSALLLLGFVQNSSYIDQIWFIEGYIAFTWNRDVYPGSNTAYRPSKHSQLWIYFMFILVGWLGFMAYPPL